MTSLTTIICSTDLSKANDVVENIKSTSGVDCQFFIHDNNFFNWSLAKTYNFYAKQAESENLLLCHQDVEFIGEGWAKEIIKKLRDRNTGTIGYAGSVIKISDCYSGWALNCNLSRNNYYYKTKEKRIHMFIEQPFDQVVVIDGLAMFVSKRHLLSHPFDEQLLTGFHCYDIDFSMQLHLSGLKNYVFTDEKFSVIHSSPGKYDKKWAKETIKLTDKKWNKFLPISCCDVDEKEIEEVRQMKKNEFQSIVEVDPKKISKRKRLNVYRVNFESGPSIYDTWK